MLLQILREKIERLFELKVYCYLQNEINLNKNHWEKVNA